MFALQQLETVRFLLGEILRRLCLTRNDLYTRSTVSQKLERLLLKGIVS